MHRCGGCRTELEAVPGTEARICPKLDCTYDGPTMSERFEAALGELLSEGKLEQLIGRTFLEEMRADGLRDDMCERCGKPFLTRRSLPVCMGCLDERQRRALGVVPFEEWWRKMIQPTEISGDEKG
jgi:hypothetical protein